MLSNCSCHLSQEESPIFVHQVPFEHNFSFEMYPNTADNSFLDVVYAPSNESGSVSVNLSVAGLVGDGTLESLPSWLNVSIPVSSFSLTAYQPYYFRIDANTTSSPVLGNYSLAVQDTIGGRSYMSYFALIVLLPITLGRTP